MAKAALSFCCLASFGGIPATCRKEVPVLSLVEGAESVTSSVAFLTLSAAPWNSLMKGRTGRANLQEKVVPPTVALGARQSQAMMSLSYMVCSRIDSLYLHIVAAQHAVPPHAQLFASNRHVAPSLHTAL